MDRSTRRRGLLAVLAIATAGIALAVSTASASATRPLVRATLKDTSGTVVGHVVFKGRHGEVSRVEVHVRASAAPGLGDFHGFHVHTTGVCTPTPSGSTNVPFGSAGGHWNPTAVGHGSHTGDMPSLLIRANGKAHAEFETDRFAVSDLLDADGSAVVLHAGRDNFANIPAVYSSGDPAVAGPNAATLGTGDAGGRFACGVVRLAS
jgi:superoxide dismutase, Cu-Zn family